MRFDTGDDTPTGGRVAARAQRLADGTFALTYADGVADVDLGAALDFHRAHGAAATMTVVRPHAQWGVAELGDDDRVAGFVEKPRLEHWINGGFFFFEPRRARPPRTRGSVLEREPLRAAGRRRRAARASATTGFWDCMDTYKDAVLLNDLWAAGTPPWLAGVPVSGEAR